MKKFVLSWSAPSPQYRRGLVKNSALTVWELCLDSRVVPNFVSCRFLSDDVKFEGKPYEDATVDHPPVEVHSTKFLLVVGECGLVYHLDAQGQLSFDFEFLPKCNYYCVNTLTLKGLLLLDNVEDGPKGYDFLNQGKLSLSLKLSTKNSENKHCYIDTIIGSKYIICNICPQYNKGKIGSKYFLCNIESKKVSDITNICAGSRNIQGWPENDSNFAFLQNNEVKVYSINDKKIIWRHEIPQTSQLFTSFISSSETLDGISRSIVFTSMSPARDEMFILREDVKKLYMLDIIDPLSFSFPLRSLVEDLIWSTIAPGHCAECVGWKKCDYTYKDPLPSQLTIFTHEKDCCPTIEIDFMHQYETIFRKNKKTRHEAISLSTKLLQDLVNLIFDYDFVVLVNEIKYKIL